MSRVRHTATLDTITRWQDRTLDLLERGDIERKVMHSQIMAWRDALLTIRDDIRTRERLIITAESLIEDDLAAGRMSLINAAAASNKGANALQHIVQFIRTHADPAERRRLELDVLAVIETFDVLTTGVPRPQTPRKGA